MCVQIKLCTSVNARQPADSWKLGTAILLSGLLHVVILLSTSLVPLATPTKFQQRKVVLEALRRALAAGHTDGQNSQRLIFLLNTSQAVSVLACALYNCLFFPPKLVDTIDFVFGRKRRNCWPSVPLKTPIGQAVWEDKKSYPGTLQKVLNIMNK